MEKPKAGSVPAPVEVRHVYKGTMSWSTHKQGMIAASLTCYSTGRIDLTAEEIPDTIRGNKRVMVSIPPDVSDKLLRTLMDFKQSLFQQQVDRMKVKEICDLYEEALSSSCECGKDNPDHYPTCPYCSKIEKARRIARTLVAPLEVNER